MMATCTSSLSVGQLRESVFQHSLRQVLEINLIADYPICLSLQLTL